MPRIDQVELNWFVEDPRTYMFYRYLLTCFLMDISFSVLVLDLISLKTFSEY